MEIQQIITDCQSLLYNGFVSAKQSGLNWLNLVCGEFLTLFKHLHKLLIFYSNGNSNIIESTFLCASQIICCIKCLENVIKTELNECIVLASSRQFFLDRMLWCLAKIKSTSFSIDNNENPVNSITEVNLVNYMDMALDLIAPLTIYNDHEIDNVAEKNAELLLESVKIRSIIDSVISHSLAFANVVELNDKKSITAICQKVLRECISYESECSIAKQSENEKNELKLNDKNLRFKAELLENALIHLESLINDCLLRLVFTVFVDIKLNPIDNLKQIKLSLEPIEQNLIDIETEKFDLILDRLMQIGIFAFVFAGDMKVKSTIRSCLASLESLDMNLIPSIFSHCSIHSSILESHWFSEIHVLNLNIQEIIDTNAFCKIFLEILSETIDQLTINFDPINVKLILNKADVLYQHFNINRDYLKFNDINSPLKIYYDDFKLMLQECKVSIEILDEIDSSRIIKRLKILYSVTKKFQKFVEKQDTKKTDDEIPNVFTNIPKSLLSSINDEDKYFNESDKFFETFGITPSSTFSILYQTRRDENKSISDSMLVKTSTNNLTQTFRSRKKRMSLRVAMFKKQKSLQTVEFLEGLSGGDTLDLHITDILDQLTDLSGTFTINAEKDNKVRIQIK